MRDPGGILGEIVARKQKDVAARLAGRTLEALRTAAAPTTRSLRAALARPRARFVMEVKRASPSGGSLRADADPAALAGAYRGAADAISVLTDGPYFGGSLADLAAVRAVFDGPILAKDFVIEPRQVPEARAHGADAVLVMLSVLEDAEAAAVMAEAARLGMDVLVEAHDEAEQRRAVDLGAAIIGINNRDLRTLSIDLAVTERLAALVPADRVLVAESGIEGRADVDRLACHVDAFLVGSSLMRAPDPRAAARALATGRVKICGLAREEDVVAAAAAGALYGGLIFVPGTPRAVAAPDAIVATAGDIGLPLAGVFRDASADRIAGTARDLGLAAVQLHGSEDAETVRRALPEEVELWAVRRIDGAVAPPRAGADRSLFDTGAGGTGRTFDWAMLGDEPDLPRALLAGGLHSGNAAAAARVGAWALDVSSGVEAAPGIKDPDKIAGFFHALRAPSRHPGESRGPSEKELPPSPPRDPGFRRDDASALPC